MQTQRTNHDLRKGKMITEKQAGQIIEQLTRIANALENIPAAPAPASAAEKAAPAPVDKPVRKAGLVPAFATCQGKPGYGRCFLCNAEIMWEQTPNGWRSYDPTSPFPLHNCKEVAVTKTPLP